MDAELIRFLTNGVELPAWMERNEVMYLFGFNDLLRLGYFDCAGCV